MASFYPEDDFDEVFLLPNGMDYECGLSSQYEFFSQRTPEDLMPIPKPRGRDSPNIRAITARLGCGKTYLF